MKYPQACILLFTRVPVVGQVKTRLIPALGAAAACAVHERLLARILGVLEQQTLCAAELWLDAAGSHPLLDRSQLPQQLQQGHDLGERMAQALAAALQHYRQVVLIGADAPGIDAACLERALACLQQDAELVLGPALDGGYVLIGSTVPAPSLFDGVAWGTDAVLQQTLQRAEAAGLRYALLEPQADIDDPQDLQYLP